MLQRPPRTLSARQCFTLTPGRGIRWLSDSPGSGYGNTGEDYISGLIEAGVPLTWSPLAWPSETWPTRHGPVRDLARHGLEQARHAALANRPIDHDTVVVHSPPLWHDRLAAEADGRSLVAHTTWETDRLPAEWVSILNRYDRVLVPSQFNQRVFSACGVEGPIDVVPHLDPSTLYPSSPTRVDDALGGPSAKDGEFVFYVIGTWITRKAIPDLVAAYLAAFSDRDAVTLVIHTAPEDRIGGWRLGCRGESGRPPQASTWFALARLLAGRARPPRIVLSTHRLSRAGMQKLHAGGDCFVTLTRGEGWGLGAFEAGAAGNPAILTGWGGSLEYLPPDYPYLVDYELISATDDAPDEWRQPWADECWARARVAHAVELMREVYSQREEAREWGQRLQHHIRDRFSAPVVTERLLTALEATTPMTARRARSA